MKSSPHNPLPATSAALDAVEEAGVPCYFANGDLAEGFHTCDVDLPVSSCCPPEYTCSGDALCVLTTPSSLEQSDLAPGTVSRGTCTEPRWNGNTCGGNCLGKATRPFPLISTLCRHCWYVGVKASPVPKCKVSLDSEDATRGAYNAPVGDGGGEKSCCAGGNASGSCICPSNVAEVTLGVAEEAQAILGRRSGPFSKVYGHQVRGEEDRLHRPSKTVSQGDIPTETGSPEMFSGGYGTWLGTSSSAASIPVITPVTSPIWSGVWSETTMSISEKRSKSATTSRLEITRSSSISSAETPITTTISIIASSLTRFSSSSSSISASISPSVIPNFPDGASAPATSSEAGTSSLATKLGLGLGIPFVVLAVAFITACVYRRQRRLRYAQAPPFDFGAPEMAPVSAVDFVPAATYRDHQHPLRSNGVQQQQQASSYRSPVASRRWSELGAEVGTRNAWTGTRATAWGGGGPYDDNQVGFVDRSSGHQGYYSYGGHEIPVPSPGPAAGYEDIGSPYEDRGHTYQVPVVQVHRPQWTPATMRGQDPDQRQGQGQGRGLDQPPQRDVARVSRGLSVNEEVSPLSSTGSGMPYPRMSAISGMGPGWETNPREARG